VIDFRRLSSRPLNAVDSAPLSSQKDFPNLALACLFVMSLFFKKPVETSQKAKMSFLLLKNKPVEKNIIFARHARINVPSSEG
jgi:hypothetical protein